MTDGLGNPRRKKGGGEIIEQKSAGRSEGHGAAGASSSWTRRMALWVPWLILFGLVVVFLILFGDRLLPAREVKVTTVVTEEGRRGEGRAAPAFKEASPHEGEALFQASGWIEADPFPVRATALLSGVVEHVHVLGGDAVRTGDPIATLVREDAEIALAAAKAAREAAENEQAVESLSAATLASNPDGRN